jgi:hypothetical protein
MPACIHRVDLSCLSPMIASAMLAHYHSGLSPVSSMAVCERRKGADWIGVGIGGASAGRDDKSAGKPFTAVFLASKVEIVDNWNVVGMQGTGRLRDLRACRACQCLRRKGRPRLLRQTIPSTHGEAA